MGKKNWIAGATSENKGALHKQAEKAGAVTKSGTIKVEWLREQAAKGGVIGKRAQLALTLRKLKK